MPFSRAAHSQTNDGAAAGFFRSSGLGCEAQIAGWPLDAFTRNLYAKTTNVQSIPISLANTFHLLSTKDFVFSSMRISSGHGRVNPSLDHLRVASTPIFEPKFGSREAWSRESTGP